jgi:hypothetical protein
LVTPRTDTPPDRGEAAQALRRRRARRWLAGAHAGSATGLALALAVLTSLLAWRLDVVVPLPRAATDLAPRTHAQIAALHDTLVISCLIERHHPAYVPLRQLLRDVRRAARIAGADIRVEFLDPHRDRVQALARLQTWGVGSNALVFECRNRRVIVPADDLIERADGQGGASRATAFRGEAACASALARLGRSRPPAVGVLTGHGERDFASYDRVVGLSSLAREIRREGYDLRILRTSEPAAASDCDVLVLAGPRRLLGAEEASHLADWLSRGGRLLLLLDPAHPCGVEPLLDRCGVRGTGLVATSPRAFAASEVTVESFADHPVARGLQNAVVTFVRPLVLSVRAAAGDDAADRVRATVVARLPADAWVEAAAESAARRVDPGTDRTNELALVAAVERGGQAGADVGFRPLRIVVAGDADFACNAMLDDGRTGNRDLFLGALNWLADVEVPPLSTPPDRGALRLGMTRRQWVVFAVMAVVLLPAGIALPGAFLAAVRRLRGGPPRLERKR